MLVAPKAAPTARRPLKPLISDDSDELAQTWDFYVEQMQDAVAKGIVHQPPDSTVRTQCMHFWVEQLVGLLQKGRGHSRSPWRGKGDRGR